MLNQKISPIKSGLLLGGSILLISLLLYFAFNNSKPLIEKNIKESRLAQFEYFLSHAEYDNDLLTSKINYQDVDFYFALKNNKIVMVFAESITKKGYSGDIRLITALNKLSNKPYPEIFGVSVVEHKETPGLGDKIDRKKSTWILQFEQKTYTNPDLWKIKKNGGEFDSLTGASISSKAVIEEVKKVLFTWNEFWSQYKNNTEQ